MAEELATAVTWTCSTCGRAYPSEFAVCPLDATPRGEAKVSGDPQIGTVLGHTYKVVSVIGQGGMARLYVAEHLRIDARFAVKIIHDELAHEPSLLARFEREARAAGRIHSEHVVQLVDVLRTADDRPCIVTELLDGEDLQARFDRDGKLSVADAIPIVRQICRGVAAAHAANVVHRDLKPSNVFLCRRAGTPLVKVFDFGIAKLDDDEKLTRTGAVMGTAMYMAPEQARRAAEAGPLADVYSIGAILYHLLTGEPPYGNLPAVSRFALLLHEEPARPRSIETSIPEGVEAVIQHAMAREPGSRIASALELETQLAMFDDSTEQVPVPRTTIPSRATTDAQSIELRARIARPLAAIVAVASSLAAAAWLTGLLGVMLEPTSHGERALIALIGLGAIGGFGALHLRALRPSWRSGPAVSRYIAPFTRALIVGTIAFGAIELAELGWFSVMHSAPVGIGFGIVVAGGFAALGFAWRSWGLDVRLRRWIG